MKTQIRQAIENIIGETHLCFTDATSPKKEKYRMKFSFRTGDSAVFAKIQNLSTHIIKVGEVRGYCGGVTVHFDCKPSQIKL